MVVKGSRLTKMELLSVIGVPKSRYYDWVKREGRSNRHNGKIPKKHWLMPEEKKKIILVVDVLNVLTGEEREELMSLTEEIESKTEEGEGEDLRESGKSEELKEEVEEGESGKKLLKRVRDDEEEA